MEIREMFGNCYAPHVENNYEFALRMCVVKFLNYLKVVTTRTNPLMLQAHKTKKKNATDIQRRSCV